MLCLNGGRLVIENCSNILQCEQKLSKEAQNVSLLGEIPLSPEDLDHLGTLICQTISPDISKGTRFLELEAPTCLACFLVWMGIVGYRDGDYWSAVRESTGLVEDPNWERRWGQIFLDFLKANDLPRFEIEGGLTYVTPILAHGGIPSSCLHEFFEKILQPMIQHDLINPGDPEEIARELAVRREDDEARAGVERQYDDLQGQIRSVARRISLAHRIAEAYEEVVELWRLEESIDLDALANLPEDYESFRDCKLADLNSLNEEIRGLEEKQACCQQAVARFTEQDKQVLAQAEAIERSISEYPALKEQLRTVAALKSSESEKVDQLKRRSAHVFSEPWSDTYGELLSLLPFDRLREEIERLDALYPQQEEGQTALNRLRASSDAALRTWPIISVASLLLGLIFIGVGVQLLLSWVLIVTGIGFTIVVGIVGWAWYRRRRSRQKELEILIQAVRDAEGEQLRVRARISRILSGLPIAEQQLRSPSTKLHGALISLADVYRQLCETRNGCAGLQQAIQQQRQRIEQIATSVGIKSADNPDALISEMKRALERARDRQAEAVCAERELEDDIQPKIAKFKAQRRAIHEELDRVEKRLAELGGGNAQAGIEWAKAQRRLQDTAAKLRRELEERYPDLETIEREIRNVQRNGKDKTVLEAEVRRFLEQREEIQAQTDRLKQELSYYPAAFPGVDEPIRRYLLYGGEPAEEFLVQSVSLVHRTETEDVVPSADDMGLPERIVKGFEYWWAKFIQVRPKEQDQQEEIDTATGRRFRAPAIFLDSHTAEVMVHFHPQRYPASIAGSSARLEVVGFNPDSQTQTFPLCIYKGAEGLVETQEIEFPLPFPVHQYAFRLKSDGNVIRQWEVTGMRNEPPYMAFDWRSGKLIEDLPRGRVWFLVRKDFSLEPVECILEKGTLHGRWKAYFFQMLELEDVGEVQLVDGQGKRFPIPVLPEKLPTLDLVGGRRLEGVHSEGAEVYVGPPPGIGGPIEDEAELRLWHVSIYDVYHEESDLSLRNRYRLSELREALDLHVDEGWIDVLLRDEMLLGQCPVGRFIIRVRKSPYTDWCYKFCVVPYLRIRFERDMYLPRESGETRRVQAEIFVPEHAEFTSQPPARLLKTEANSCAVEISGAENALRGTLCLRALDKRDHRIPLTISIPKVRWRLQGLEDNQYVTWCDTIEEMWLGDWETASELFLIVALPSFVDGCLRLSLDGGSAKEEASVLRGGKAQFDLLAFGDALRVGPSVQTFTLTLPGSEFGIEHVPLFKVRTRWEVENIECVQNAKGPIIILNMTWSEKGKTGDKDRVVRLWSSSSAPAVPIVEQKVLEGTCSATLQANARDLPPGEYLLQLTLEDLWSTTEISRPARNALNTRVIEIVPMGDIRQGQVLSICSIADDDGQLYQLDEEAYKIRIVGKIINRRLPTGVGAEHVRVTRAKNEGWYVGNIEVVGDPELEVEIDQANPVKFDYDVSKDVITAIEDREGDGAMYCRQCRKLYWSRKANTEEEQKEHPIFGPVEVFRIH